MMKKQKTFAMITAAMMLAAVTSACGNQAGNSESTSNSQSSTPASGTSQSSASESKPIDEKPAPIHIFNRLNPEVSVDNNPILDALEKELNVEITYEAPPINNYLEKLQITMASGKIPDIIYNWGGADSNYEQWAKDGLIAELDDKLPNYPNISQNVPTVMMETMRSVNTGKIMSVAKPNMVNYNGFLMNQKWLDAVGMKAPTTLEELREVMKAFTQNDPDGNGKKDTYGFSTAITGTQIDITPIQSAFGISNIKDTDGEYKIRQKMSGYVPYLTYLRDLYADGSLDPEFFTNKYMVDLEKFRAGTVGAVTQFQTGVFQQLKFQDEETVLNTYTYVAPPKNVNTDKATVYSVAPIWGCWMISTEANVDKCLELIDYGHSQEGFTLMNMGIEGTDYNSYDFTSRSVDRTTDQATKLGTYSSSYFTFAFAKDGAPAIYENVDNEKRLEKFTKEFDAVKSAVELVNVKNPKTPKYNTFNSDNPDLIKKCSEYEVKYVVGEMSKEDFEAFLEKEYFPVAAEMEAEYVAWMKENDK